jgi:mannose-6-phosphate isomerase-like protein (cupin superfamily)
MDDFPEFMKSSANRIATSSQATPGEAAVSAPHVHDYDEYMVVVQGCYTLIVDGKKVPVKAGEEYFIPKGLWHGGEPVAGTRTIHAFGGRRVERA